jgi:hypothetical protein
VPQNYCDLTSDPIPSAAPGRRRLFTSQDGRSQLAGYSNALVGSICVP